jgi:hypothetical protein
MGNCQSLTADVGVTKGEGATFEFINSPQESRRTVPGGYTTLGPFKLNDGAWKLLGWGESEGTVARLNLVLKCRIK